MKTLFLLAVLCFVLASSINLERLSSVNVEQQRALNPGKQALPTQEKGQKVKSNKYTSIATKKFPESKQDPSKAQAVESALKNKAKSKPAAPKYKKVDPVILAAVKAGLGEYGRVVEGSKDNKELNGIAFGWDVKEKKPVLTFSFKKGKGAKCPGTVPKTILCTAVEEEVDEKAFARLEIGDMVVAHGQQASVGACLTTGLPPAGSGDYIVSSWHGHAQRYDDVIEPLRPETVGWISTWPMPPHVGNSDFDLAYLTAGHTCVCPGKPIATESAASLDEFVASAALAAAENYEPKLTVEGAWMGQKDLAATAKLNLRQILRSYTAANVGIQFTNMIRVEFELGSPNPGDSGGALYIEGALLGITSGGGHSGINHWGYFTPIWNVADALKANANHLNFC